MCRLQDVHWSSGAFGYFPTYSLGMRGFPILPQTHLLANATLLLPADIPVLWLSITSSVLRHLAALARLQHVPIMHLLAMRSRLRPDFPTARCSCNWVRRAGAMYACQIYRAAEKDLPSLAEDVAAGRFAPLRAWLREKIHKVRGARARSPSLAGSRCPDALLACACYSTPLGRSAALADNREMLPVVRTYPVGHGASGELSPETSRPSKRRKACGDVPGAIHGHHREWHGRTSRLCPPPLRRLTRHGSRSPEASRPAATLV